jgi:hypothetical protein
MTFNLGQHLYRNELRQDEGNVDSYREKCLRKWFYKPSPKTEGNYYKNMKKVLGFSLVFGFWKSVTHRTTPPS